MLVTSHSLSAFLASTRYIDHEDSAVRVLVDARGWRRMETLAAACAAFEFVRDEVRHSWDVRRAHGLNTAFLQGRWIRLDARGNKPGIDAQFSLEIERLAFRVRPEMGEHQYDENFCDVHPTIVRALESQDDLHVLIEQLPDAL